MAGASGNASTIYAVLARRGLSRLRDLDRPTGVPIRYVRSCPGELVHVDDRFRGISMIAINTAGGRGRGSTRWAGWRCR